ncbi:15-hydroxyprostaglandin dehydrogenase [NAD(+)]-like [Actinia tenebrosa]|uniref:15-hydroxyprostaglandin dehydrogenase [NAD(+)] n=1 Tax=Actinia tenebrosa TaxID=6105 RepID=A0A6P8HBU8_ACTTE|nr:15-hydroxyprostaglandin dehydrogenase [NAD(+)]-like [Actinia tenebrosa]
MKIKGSVALITGGAQGIGREICKALLERGAKVSILDIKKEIGQDQVKNFQNKYGESSVAFVPCDVTNKNQMEAAFQRSWDVFGNIDIVCNNAGIVHTADMTDGVWDKMIDVNVKGVVHGTILGIKYMSTNGSMGHGGTIINVASIAGLIPATDMPVYAATKHAVVGLTRSLEGLKDSDGVRINCICPSFTDTPMVVDGGLTNPQFQDRLTAKYIRKFGLLRPELIASGVIELIEDDTKNAAVMRVTKQNGIDYKKYFQPKL